MKKAIRILAIETSCDETAAAVICGTNSSKKQETRNKKQVCGTPIVLSNIVSSQIDLHAKTGGVVPEVASRAHMEAILPVIEEALLQANLKFKIQNLELNENCKLPKGPADGGKIENLLGDITHIAVTAGPGLIGSLLVGFNTAKALAYSLDLPIIPVNHIEGHVYSAMPNTQVESRKSPVSPEARAEVGNPKQIENNKVEIKKAESLQLAANSFPIVALTVSGGHTSLTLVKDHGEYENLGSTLDDAAGEAFDKVAKLLDLGYPGGPEVSRLASAYREKLQITNNKCQIKPKVTNSGNVKNDKNLYQSVEKISDCASPIIFPRPIMNDGTFNFSFSGLKTAVLETVRKYSSNETRSFSSRSARTISDDIKSEVCAAFEDAAVDVLTTKAMRAVEKFKPKGLILAGGVAANRRLQEELTRKVNEFNEKADKKDQIELFIPPRDLTGDNAAMIGLAAFFHISKGDVKHWNEIEVDSNMKL